MQPATRQTFSLRRQSIVFATALILSFGGLAAQANASKAAQGDPLLFGAESSRRADLKPFPKWTTALERFYKERAEASNLDDCASAQFNKCHYRDWMKVLKQASRKKKKAQLKAINKYFNKAKYIVDPKNWGVKDYWATPGEFFQKYGDCEDYAIAKYLSLRALGWKADDMRIVVLQDMNLKIPHAVLAVNYKGKFQVLDNQIGAVIDSARVQHYKPIFSVNEEAWWRHKPKR